MRNQPGQILDYSGWIQRVRSFPTELGFEPPTLVHKPHWCPYCRQEAGNPIIGMRSDKSQAEPSEHASRHDHPWHSFTAYICETCGWWNLGLMNFESGPHGDCNEANYRAVLRSYAVQDLNLPIEALRQALSTRPQVIFGINDRKMEQLVADVLRDYIPGSEVSVCGKSGDGGIDLIMVAHEVPFAVQVKRRTRPGSVERVDAVRAFLGASLLRGFDHLMYVTTADHFTGGPYGAETAAEVAKRRRLVREFHLIDRNRLFAMLRLVTTGRARTWERLLPPILQDLGFEEP